MRHSSYQTEASSFKNQTKTHYGKQQCVTFETAAKINYNSIFSHWMHPNTSTGFFFPKIDRLHYSQFSCDFLENLPFLNIKRIDAI